MEAMMRTLHFGDHVFKLGIGCSRCSRHTEDPPCILSLEDLLHVRAVFVPAVGMATPTRSAASAAEENISGQERKEREHFLSRRSTLLLQLSRGAAPFHPPPGRRLRSIPFRQGQPVVRSGSGIISLNEDSLFRTGCARGQNCIWNRNLQLFPFCLEGSGG